MHVLEKPKRKVAGIGDARVWGRMQNYSRWSGLSSLKTLERGDLSQDFKEVRELAMQISEERAFWAEGKASAKTMRWEHA